MNTEILKQQLKEKYNIQLLEADIDSQIGHWEIMTENREHITIEITRLNPQLLELFGDVEAHTEYLTLNGDEILEVAKIFLPEEHDKLCKIPYVLSEDI